MNIGVPYRIYLPDWVFVTSENYEEVEKKAKEYLEKSYSDRELIEVQGRFALCRFKL